MCPQDRHQCDPCVVRPRKQAAAQLDAPQRVLQICPRPDVFTPGGRAQPSAGKQWEHREERRDKLAVHAVFGEQRLAVVGAALICQRIDQRDHLRILVVTVGQALNVQRRKRPSASAARRSPRRCLPRPRNHSARASHCGEPVRSACRIARRQQMFGAVHRSASTRQMVMLVRHSGCPPLLTSAGWAAACSARSPASATGPPVQGTPRHERPQQALRTGQRRHVPKVLLGCSSRPRLVGPGRSAALRVGRPRVPEQARGRWAATFGGRALHRDR